MSKFCIPKKLMQRQINRMDKVVWEMLKCTHIIKQHEFKEQNEEQYFDEEVFYTHPKSSSQIITMEECFEFGVYS